MTEKREIDKKQMWFGIGMIAAGVLYMGQCILIWQGVFGLVIYWYDLLVSSAFCVLLILGALYLWGEDRKQHPYIETMMALMGFWALISWSIIGGGNGFLVITIIAAILLSPLIYIQFRVFRNREWRIAIPLVLWMSAPTFGMIFKNNLAQGYTRILIFGLCYVFAGIGYIKTKKGVAEELMKAWKIIGLYGLVFLVTVIAGTLLTIPKSFEYTDQQAKTEAEAFLEKPLPEAATDVKMRYIERPGFAYETYITFNVPENQAESWLNSGVDTIDTDLKHYMGRGAAHDALFFSRDSYWYDAWLDARDEKIIRESKLKLRPEWWNAFPGNRTRFMFNDSGFKMDILLVYYEMYENDEVATIWVFGMHE